MGQKRVELVLTYFPSMRRERASHVSECHIYSGVEIETENLQGKKTNVYISDYNFCLTDS